MPPPHTDRTALIAATGCFTAWGLFPLFFQAAGRAGADAWEVLAWRIVASAPTAGVLVWASGQGPALLALARRPGVLAALGLSGTLIAVNWAVYIWSVQHGQTLATSLGYYLNPLLNVAVGAALFRERLSAPARLALALAVVGVALQAMALGGVPWIPLVLAMSFCAYGVIRKRVAVEAQTGLLVETMLLVAPAAAYLAVEGAHGGAAFGRSTAATLLLLAAGPITVAPLIAFAVAARRLPLTLLGFLQFIQPTILFGLGALAGEPVTPLRLLSFAAIWAGVAVFAGGAWRRRPAPA